MVRLTRRSTCGSRPPAACASTRRGRDGPRIGFAEYWTLAKRDGHWTLVSIEQDAEGIHNLDEEVVASPWSDSRVRDEALVEQAVADRVPEGFAPADAAVVEFAGNAREAALDLSLADAASRPTCSRSPRGSAVAAWAEAVDGDDAPLERVASAEAIDALLYGGDAQRRTRLVVRGPRVERVTIEAPRRTGRARADAPRGRRARPALPRGPRHRGDRRRARATARPRSRSAG